MGDGIVVLMLLEKVVKSRMEGKEPGGEKSGSMMNGE